MGEGGDPQATSTMLFRLRGDWCLACDLCLEGIGAFTIERLADEAYNPRWENC